MGRMSREKGKRGEREFAKILEGIGFDARRSQQFSGAAGDADLVTSLPGVHWEIKRYAKVAAVRFLEQAERDSKEDLAVVALREDRGSWVIMLRADNLEDLARRIVASLPTSTITPDSSSRSSPDGGERDTSETSIETR